MAAYHNVAKVYDAQGNEEQRLQYLKHAYSLAQQMGDTVTLGNLRFDIAKIYDRMGLNEEVLKFTDDSGYARRSFGLDPLPVPLRPSSPSDSADLLLSRVPYDISGLSTDLHRKIGMLQRVADLYGAAGSYWNSGTIERRIAACFAIVGERDSVVAYLGRARSASQRARDSSGMAIVHLARGRLAQELGELDVALQEYGEARRRAEQARDTLVIGSAVVRIALLNRSQGHADAALSDAWRALGWLADTTRLGGDGSIKLDKNLMKLVDAWASLLPPPENWTSIDHSETIVSALHLVAAIQREYGNHKLADAYDRDARNLAPHASGQRPMVPC